MRQGFDRGVIVGIVLLAVMTVAIAATSHVSTRALRAGSRRAAHSLTVLDGIGTVRSDTRKLQAEQRAYLITGLDEWVRPYEDAAAALRADAAALAARTAQDPDQHQRALAAQRDIETGIANMNEVVRLRGRPKGHEAVVALARERGRRSFVDPLLETLAEMDRAERGRQAALETEADEAYTRSVFYGAITAALGLVAIGTFVVLLRRSVRARTRAAARLDEQRELLNATLFSIGDAVIATDARGNVTFLNPVAEALTGWSRDDARGVPIDRVFHIVNESNRAPVENPALQALKHGKIVGLANHTVLVARNGVERPIEDSAAPIRSRGGISGAVLVFRDVTERRRAEAGLARLAAIVESSDDAIVGKTLDGTIRSWNAGAERLFGYTAGEAIGRSITLIVPPERVAEEKALLDRLVAGERAEHFETVRVTRDGRRLDISLTISPIRDREGRVIGASKVARNVTDRKLAEAERARLTETLELALSAADLGTWVWDPVTDLVTLSDRAADIYGVPAGRKYTREWLRGLLRPEYRQPAQEAARRAVTERGDYDTEYQLDHSQNGRVWIAVWGRGAYDPAGELVRMLGVCQDVTARRGAENALRASEARVRLATEAAGLAVWTWEPAADLVVWENDRPYELFGVPRTDVPITAGRFVAEFLHPDDAPGFARAVAGTLETGQRFHFRGRFRRPNGDLRWIELTGRLEPAAPGAPARIVGTGADITDLTRAAERERQTAVEALAAAEANAKFRTFFEQGSNFAGVMKLDGTLVEANRLCLHACGYAREDVIGRKFWECGWWNRSPAVTAAVRRGSEGAAEGRPVRLETPYYFADGSERIIDLVLAPVTDPAGRALFVAATGTDVTDRTRDEAGVRFLADASASLAELVDYESTLGRIANLAVGGFADWCVVDVLDAAGERRRLAVANPSAGEALARGAGAAFRPGRDAIAGIPHVLRTGEPVVVPDLTALDPATDPQGERIVELRTRGVRSYLSVPLLSRGRVIGGMTFLSTSSRYRYGPAELRVARDLAARVTTAIENASLYLALQEQDRRKDEFLATLAHELRNPLAPIRNGVQILRTALPPDARLGRTLGMMERQLGHMVHLIDDLMDVARVSSGKVLLRKERVDLRDAAGSAVETIRQAIDTNRHEMDVRLPDEPLVISADRTRLTQILANLLNNAAKYTPPGGRIVLTAAGSGTEAVIRVTDTGIGIPADMLHRIFDMFTQVGTSLDRAQGGVGIGLTLVKRLVEMHGGSVTAHSPGPGRGSEFVVRLPLAPAEIGDRTAASLAGGRSGSEPRLTILVVDDNRDAADTLCDLLGLKGHEVLTANDGPEALRVLEAFRPNLILLDLGLPGMNGFEVARRVRENPDLRGVTIAALTGWGQDEDRRRTREGGFDHHLVKPVNIDDLDTILTGLRRDHE
ncbi:PAS domain S-box protein [Frigoriglobus tundricola]|uniref:histidine kinase n=1 Tax=Frigoriglobus tundricola TaxID=2774151 RepID=A0A6M5Z4Z4_9BACT|nr:PAS domain S-box protein [Frigoriglobus tundricola]QJX00534.1 Histidine kinase [Frigoriglobus tundricola]